MVHYVLPHRIGDLENRNKHIGHAMDLPHRIGDLENCTAAIHCWVLLPHRIGDLENPRYRYY